MSDMIKEAEQYFEDEKNEGMFSGEKSKEEQLAKSMLRILKDKSSSMGVDIKRVLDFMVDKYR